MESGELNVRMRAPIVRKRVLHRLAGWTPPGLRAKGAAEALRGHSLVDAELKSMRESAPPPIDLSETVDGAFPAVAPARALHLT